MGLFDQFSNLNPEQAQGLMAAAAQMLMQSGPSRTPTSLGQVMGGGIGAYQGATAEAKRRKLMEDEAAQMKQLTGLKIRDAESDFQNQETARTQAAGVADLSKNYFASAPQAPARAAIEKMQGPTMQNAAQLEQLQAQAPAQGQPNRFESRMGWADHLRKNGYNTQAEAEEKAALAFQPKVKTWEKVREGGKVLFKPYFEDGTAGDAVTAEAAEKLEFRNLGGKTVGLDQYTGAQATSYENTQSPDNKASVAASYANANATRAVAGATRDAAVIQRNQATEMKMGDDYRAQSKGFKEVSDAYRQINATLGKATTSPAATLAGATKFMKLLDPGSVVRESELGMALAASGVLDRAGNYYQTLLKGKVLTPTQVNDFKNITKDIYAAAQTGQRDIDTSYRTQAETYGLRPQMIVQDFGQNNVENGDGEKKPSAAPAMAEMPKANASNKGRVMKDHQTGKRYQSNGLQWKEMN